MKKIKRILMLSCAVLAFVACTKDDETPAVKAEATKVTPEILAKLSALSFNTKDVKVIKHTNANGVEEDVFLIEGDIIMSEKQINSMNLFGGITSEQYHTTNLVSGPRTIRVVGLTGNGPSALSANMRSGLQTAVNRYNALNLTLKFSLTFSSSTTGANIVVRRERGGAGGVAGFPTGGNPFSTVTLYSGMDTYSAAVNSHVAAHEIGHCIGLRHTDWFSRQSCGQNTNEGTAGVGAIHIPGTPTGYDATSYMRACFSASDTGVFNTNDVTALNYLY